MFVVLAHAFLALLESRRSLSVEPRRYFSINSKSTLIKADGVEIYGLTVRRPRKSAIADAKIQTECSDQSSLGEGAIARASCVELLKWTSRMIALGCWWLAPA